MFDYMTPFWWTWLISGVISGMILPSVLKDEDDDEDENSSGGDGVIAAIFGVLGFIGVAVTVFYIFARYMAEQEDKQHQQESDARAAARVVAAKKQKKKIITTYLNEIDKLEQVKNKFQDSPDQLPQKFFKDAHKLASDLQKLSKKEIQQSERAVDIIRFARINIYSCFPESKEKERGKIEANLTKALKKL
jgi:hypothetical protein